MFLGGLRVAWLLIHRILMMVGSANLTVVLVRCVWWLVGGYGDERLELSCVVR